MAADTKLKALEGNDLADYARKEIPQGRWSDGWGVFKSNFVKIIGNNMLTLVFFVPLVVVLYMHNLYLDTIATYYPYATNIGPASPHPTPEMVALDEGLQLTYDILFYSLAIVAGLIACVGVAGCFYSMKKLLGTHGKFSVKSYFHGVRVCYLNTALPVMFFSIVLFATVIVCDWKEYTIALGNSAGWPITAMVLMIILTVVVGLLTLWLVAVGVSYKVKPWQLLKNSCIILVGFIIQTVFMAGIAFIPVWLLLIGASMSSSVVTIITFIIFIIFGFSYVGIVWMGFTQWAFDLYITPSIEKEKAVARSKMSEKELAAEKEEEDRRAAQEILAAGKSELVGRPIKPMEGESVAKLGGVFSRTDVAAVAASRNELENTVASYEQEHKNDPVYVEYNKLFEEREKALKDDSKKGKKKKVSADNLLR